MRTLNPKNLAELEIMWWGAYHTRDWSSVEEIVIKLRKEQFGVDIDKEAASHFVSAGNMYIAYKEALIKSDKKLAKEQLEQANLYMKQHYESIGQKLKEQEEAFREGIQSVFKKYDKQFMQLGEAIREDLASIGIPVGFSEEELKELKDSTEFFKRYNESN